MKTKSNDFYNLGLYDPEWGIGASKPSIKNSMVTQKNGSKTKIKLSKLKNKHWDKSHAPEEWYKEAVRVSENQIIWGANFLPYLVKQTFKPPRRKDFDMFIKKYPMGWIIWDKMNGNSDQWDCELAWTSFNRPTIIKKYLWSGMMQGSKLDGTIQEGNKKLNEKRIHQTQKPIQLCKWQLNEYASADFKVLDTNGGSAGLSIACWDLEIDLDLCETDNDYFNDSWKRFETHSRQQQLF